MICAEKLKALPGSKVHPSRVHIYMAAKAIRDRFTEEQVQSQMQNFGRYEETQVYLEVGHRLQDMREQVLKD